MKTHEHEAKEEEEPAGTTALPPVKQQFPGTLMAEQVSSSSSQTSARDLSLSVMEALDLLDQLSLPLQPLCPQQVFSHHCCILITMTGSFPVAKLPQAPL